MRHLRLADAEGMRERTITLGSGGKLFSLTGWRVAWAMVPPHLITPLGQAHTHMTLSAPTPCRPAKCTTKSPETYQGKSELNTHWLTILLCARTSAAPAYGAAPRVDGCLDHASV